MLYGRDRERARTGELLRGARESRSGTLVIRGEAGVGKSALLEDARERAGDMAVLSAAGVESEAHLPFAAVHQLVRPVLGYVEGVPDPRRPRCGPRWAWSRVRAPIASSSRSRR
jgi:hypothetical protein